MQRELILHIGTTKTGSTSIQSVLDSRRKELPAQGIYWPETHDAKRHLLLALANSSIGRFHLMVGNPLWRGMQPADRITQYRREFAAEMQALDGDIKKVVISAEQFSEMLRTPNDVSELKAMLDPHFSTITVVIYLRRQDSHYASMYAQMLRMGNLHEADLAGVKIGFNHDYNYYNLLTRWADVFGYDNLQPRLFERTTSAKFDVVDDFLSFCGINLTLSEDDHKRARNPSMNVIGQQILLKTGQALAAETGEKVSGSVLWSKVAEAVTQVATGTGWLPTRAEAQSSIDRFAASNEAVRARWFSHRETLFDNNLSKLPETEPLIDYQMAFDTACNALLEATQTALRREQAMLLQVAKLAETAGDYGKMQSALVQIINTDKHNVPARVQLAEHHVRMGNLPQAQGIMNAVAEIAPLSPGLARLRKLIDSPRSEQISRADPASRASRRGSRP